MSSTIKKTPKKITKDIEKPVNLKVPLLGLNEDKKDFIKLPKEIFQVETKPALLAQYVRVYLANQRQGTLSTKTRGEVSGSTRKIYRQKGTGRARHGDIKAPIFVGGGVAHGPKPRDFSLQVNKKQKRKVFFASLTLKNNQGKLLVVKDNVLDMEPKTKRGETWIKELLKNEKSKKEKITIVLPKMKKNNFILAMRNIPQVSLLSIDNLNPFEILKSNYLIFLESALERLIKVYLKENQ